MTPPIILKPMNNKVRTFLRMSHKLLINGTLVDAVNGETFETLNPLKQPGLSPNSKGRRGGHKPIQSVYSQGI